jgi:hypothetical protein
VFGLFACCVLPQDAFVFSNITTDGHLVKCPHSVSQNTQHPQANLSKIAANIILGLTVPYVISLYIVTLYVCNLQQQDNTVQKELWTFGAVYELWFTYEVLP